MSAYKKYTNEDILKMIQLSNEDKSFDDIALSLDRTIGGIQSKIMKTLIEFDESFNKEIELTCKSFIKKHTNSLIEKYNKQEEQQKIKITLDKTFYRKLNNVIKNKLSKMQVLTDLTDDQIKGFESFVDKKNIFLTGPAGCYNANTKIMLFDGNYKLSQNIKKGDILMGDDNTPRKVLNTINGLDNMFLVKNNAGSFIVNSQHTLCMILESRKRINILKNKISIKWISKNLVLNKIEFKISSDNKKEITLRAKEFYNKIDFQYYIDITVDEYMKLEKNIKSKLYSYHSYTHYDEKETALDPYVMGGMFGMNLLSHIQCFNLESYIVNSKSKRLQFLAGIIDSIFEIYNNNYHLYLDNDNDNKNENESNIEILLNLLNGLSINYKYINNEIIIKEKNIYCKYVISQKKEYNCKKNIKLVKTEIKQVGVSYYYGFLLNGNNKHKLYNSIVSHNCGKTHLIKTMISYMKSQKISYALTASTGVAALLIGGTTIHSLLKLGIGNRDIKSICESIMGNNKTYRLLRNLQVLIIDEISMIDNVLFSKIGKVLSVIQGINKPFGNIQVVACGDFLQLKPVENTYCFHSKAWEMLNLEIIHLNKQMRQTDIELENILQEIRYGNISDNAYSKLKSRVDTLKNEYSIDEMRPTILYSRNIDVDSINKKELEKLISHTKSDIKFYGIEKVTKKTLYESETKTKEIGLSIGCQVMVTYNVNLEKGIVNGTRGVVVKLEDENVLIKTKDNKIHIIPYITYDDEKSGEVMYKYMPIKLAYATTIHKSQGQTLDYIAIDLGQSIFAPSQSYVALSRAKTLDSIIVLNLDKSSFHVNQEAINFYKPFM